MEISFYNQVEESFRSQKKNIYLQQVPTTKQQKLTANKRISSKT